MMWCYNQSQFGFTQTQLCWSRFGGVSGFPPAWADQQQNRRTVAQLWKDSASGFNKRPTQTADALLCQPLSGLPSSWLGLLKNANTHIHIHSRERVCVFVVIIMTSAHSLIGRLWFSSRRSADDRTGYCWLWLNSWKHDDENRSVIRHSEGKVWVKESQKCVTSFWCFLCPELGLPGAGVLLCFSRCRREPLHVAVNNFA